MHDALAKGKGNFMKAIPSPLGVAAVLGRRDISTGQRFGKANIGPGDGLFAVSVGQVEEVGHYLVRMGTVGSGVGLAVVLSRTRIAASPLGGMTTISENVWTVAKMVAGRWAEIRFHKDWPGSHFATAGVWMDR